MAHLPMGQAVYITEYDYPRMKSDTGAKSHLAAQMFTDAVFNQDIRVIQTIVQRIDGGLPKDTELSEYKTEFGDCLNEVLALESHMQLVVVPDDTVMMALCKSLYDIASSDIYHEIKSDAHGNKWSKKVNPSTEKKQARDSALRLVLERSGGRKTITSANRKEIQVIEVASWITMSLPQKGEEDDAGDQA